MPKLEELSYVMLFFSYIMRNSYIFTLILSFWISLYTANLIHIILLIFTIMFIVKQQKQ